MVFGEWCVELNDLGNGATVATCVTAIIGVHNQNHHGPPKLMSSLNVTNDDNPDVMQGLLVLAVGHTGSLP